MSGIKLGSLEASDMVDVLHFLFEEDNYFASGEEMDARNKVRTSIYHDMYGEEYQYGSTSGQSTQNSEYMTEYPPESDDDADIKPFNPRAKEVQAYSAPTPFNPDSASPFGSILDSPL